MENTLTVLRKIKECLVKANEQGEGSPITDTIWLDDTTTLFDYIDISIDLHERVRNLARHTKSTLVTVGYDADGKRVVSSSRSTQDPSGDHDMMEAFLELEQAYRLRSVEIKGHKLGSLWVTSTPPEITRERLKVDAYTYLRAAIDVAEAKGQVVTIELQRWFGQYRMGGYSMVPRVRDGYAEVQRKMNAPARIVRASNYDDEFFFEKFVGETMTHYAATLEAEKLNGAADRNDRYYFKVVGVDYTLHAFEP